MPNESLNREKYLNNAADNYNDDISSAYNTWTFYSLLVVDNALIGTDDDKYFTQRDNY